MNFFQPYSYFEKIGSVGSITNQLADTIEQLRQKQKTPVPCLILGSVWHFETLALGVYYSSLITATSMIAFLHLAQAIGYGLVFAGA